MISGTRSETLHKSANSRPSSARSSKGGSESMTLIRTIAFLGQTSDASSRGRSEVPRRVPVGSQEGSARSVPWYESQRLGLGSRFLAGVGATLDEIRRLPDGHQLVSKRTR